MHRRHALILDAAVPVITGAVILAGTLLHGGPSARPLPIALGLGAAATLFARRRAPGWTLAISGVLVGFLFHIDRPAGAVAVVAPAVALYSLALTRSRVQQLLAAVAAVGAIILADALHSGSPTVLQTCGHVLLIAIPVLAAQTLRTHRSNVSLMSERLELAERNREQEGQRRAEQERMRFARELHDVVAHTLTTINVQAASAAERIEAGEARTTLESIEQTSHQAIGELRAILGVLRDPDARDAPLVPTPGVENIADLVSGARDTGLEVQLHSTGERPAHVSDAVSLAAYRIIQESLTNARRHGSGAAVGVNVCFDDAAMSLTIESSTNASTAGNGAGPGVGIAGMRERAAAIGGTLQAGPIRDGFRVHAELPYELR